MTNDKDNQYILYNGRYHRLSDNKMLGGRDQLAQSLAEELGGGYRMREREITDDDGNVKRMVEYVSIASGGAFAFDSPVGALFGQNAWADPDADRNAMLEDARRMWKYDPLGGAIVDLTAFFTFGKGIRFQYDDEAAQAYLTRLWDLNRMPIKIKQMCRSGTAFGEVFFWLRPVFRKRGSGAAHTWYPGDVVITSIDPQNIQAIDVSAVDPDDVIQYHYSYESEDGTQTRIIRDLRHYRWRSDRRSGDGCILHLKFNSSVNDIFGHSSLMRVKEWLDNYQEFLRDGVLINKLYRSPCYDVTLHDADESDVAAAKSRYANWRIGTNPVHNDKEEWKILEFTGANMSSQESRRALLLIIAAGMNLHEYMLADGNTTNLATSKSQQVLVIKKFEDLQSDYCEAIKDIFEFALNFKYSFAPPSSPRMRPQKNEFGDSIWPGKIEFPPIVVENDTDVATANEKALADGYMSRTTAARRLNTEYATEAMLLQAEAKIRSKHGLDEPALEAKAKAEVQATKQRAKAPVAPGGASAASAPEAKVPPKAAKKPTNKAT